MNRKIGNSVERNYIKRRLKELFRTNDFILETNYDVWVVMKKKFDRNDSVSIERIFKDYLTKINYIKI